MKKEVFRSFEGKLDFEHQSGYIIYDTGKFWQVEYLSVWGSERDMFRIRKELLQDTDFSDSEKIFEIENDIEYGRADYGQYFYKGKWYGYDAICNIQNKNQSNEWKRFVV